MSEPNGIQAMTISLLSPLKKFVEDQVAGGEYASVSAYIASLVRADQKRQAKEQLEHVLLGALQSQEGDPMDLTPEIVEEFRQRLHSRTPRH
jgi:putative addiction module CopG family antidote